MSAVLAHRVDAPLRPDPARVIARLFLPGEEPPIGPSRASNVVSRVLALGDDEVEAMAARIVESFSGRHANYAETLAANASIVSAQVADLPELSAARTAVMGASFTAEYAVEAAALCNPCAVPHPDQTGVAPGQLRVAVSLRGIGEGHISSLGFAEAMIGPGATWSFGPRQLAATGPVPAPYTWRRHHLLAVLADQGRLDQLSRAVFAALPELFTDADMNRALAEIHPDLLQRAGATTAVDLLRRTTASAYGVSFGAELDLSQRVLLPTTSDERNGMEDARFVRFTDQDGQVDYRATYTAYDGHQITPRLLTSPDLRTFSAHRLAGPAARNKGMALFPRLIDGKHWALCRSDGENTSVTTSDDGFAWGPPIRIQKPEAAWELLQIGNCGSPIETDQGWLVLTHGVGPMRVYAIGALLLDLDDPTRIRARLAQPLLEPTEDERDGYVSNVVYSCGGLIHDGRLWLPYGISDARIGVAWASVDELLGAMEPVSAALGTRRA